MEDWEQRIIIDNEIMGGKPVIKGTRLPLEVIVGEMAGGSTIEEICTGYDITEEDVRAALAYAAETLAIERVHALPRR
jgi:uncharacterized protein (DUF433 family)